MSGLSPERAFRMGSLHPAEYYRVSDRIGAIAPGRCADILLMRAPDAFPPEVLAAAEAAAQRKPTAHVDRTERAFVTLDPAGAASVSGEVKGYKAPVYAVPVAAAQTLIVTFEPSNTNLYVNVVDSADTSGAAQGICPPL